MLCLIPPNVPVDKDNSSCILRGQTSTLLWWVVGGMLEITPTYLLRIIFLMQIQVALVGIVRITMGQDFLQD